MSSLTTRYLMTCAAIGAALGVLLIPANFVSAPLAAAAPMAYAPLVGLWIIGPVLATALVRRPAAALLTSFVAGVVSSASPVGAWSIVTCLMAGAAVELAFLVTRYRVWRSWLFYVDAVVLGVLYVASGWAAFDMAAMSPVVLVTFVVLMVGSFVVCTALGLLLARKLARVGVARGLAPAPVRTAVPEPTAPTS
ncbi:energy-coupling factor transport system substrate-specific component [Isoptericola jiangsuensis]|uniref:Energy-coupling factor transport system substrate-specific component n=1 Tax=Isoptericola jiangsuensis TaxID=548579 RepID=A0A2A9F1W2_9MICO|nr:ECF transporter S component [Isoptericola jiangsuensis]PFG44532.1 energy-coupling factor transport system substrate-specific component [Isoptericola jiangsuensis]